MYTLGNVERFGVQEDKDIHSLHLAKNFAHRSLELYEREKTIKVNILILINLFIFLLRIHVQYHEIFSAAVFLNHLGCTSSSTLCSFLGQSHQINIYFQKTFFLHTMLGAACSPSHKKNE